MQSARPSLSGAFWAEPFWPTGRWPVAHWWANDQRQICSAGPFEQHPFEQQGVELLLGRNPLSTWPTAHALSERGVSNLLNDRSHASHHAFGRLCLRLRVMACRDVRRPWLLLSCCEARASRSVVRLYRYHPGILIYYSFFHTGMGWE